MVWRIKVAAKEVRIVVPFPDRDDMIKIIRRIYMLGRTHVLANVALATGCTIFLFIMLDVYKLNIYYLPVAAAIVYFLAACSISYAFFKKIPLAPRDQILLKFLGIIAVLCIFLIYAFIGLIGPLSGVALVRSSIFALSISIFSFFRAQD
jgi:hypothetical protein